MGPRPGVVDMYWTEGGDKMSYWSIWPPCERARPYLILFAHSATTLFRVTWTAPLRSLPAPPRNKQSSSREKGKGAPDQESHPDPLKRRYAVNRLLHSELQVPNSCIGKAARFVYDT